MPVTNLLSAGFKCILHHLLCEKQKDPLSTSSFASWHDVNICQETTGRTQHGKKPFLLGSGVLPGWLLQHRQLLQGHELALAAQKLPEHLAASRASVVGAAPGVQKLPRSSA